MNTNIFRAYDIRGKYPDEINENIAYTIGRSYGSYLQEKYNQKSCVVSFDNRLSSPTLATSLMKGITESGCNIINLGQTTTPMNYYGRYLNKIRGIMVTASHNPKDENGFKFSFEKMVNARGEMIEDFKNYTLAGQFLSGMGTLTENNITDKYIEYLRYSMKWGKNKRKIIVDCGNGVTCTIARKVFSNSFCEFEIINEENDGSFPNHHPDPAVKSNLEQLKKAVIEKKADFGVAYDGDGDRIGIVMENGEDLPIEHFMILMIKDMFNSVANKTFLYDIKCSKSVQDEIDRLGGTGICFRTGASYTQYETLMKNLPFGGEYSGHIYFRDRDVDCGSALYATLRLLELLSKTSAKLSDLCQSIPKYYATEEMTIPSTDEKKFLVTEKIKAYAQAQNYTINDIDGVRITFTNGWVSVRASNTGKNISFRAEADTPEGLEMLQKIFLPLIEEYNK
ncbi:MAG: phosphomannomutase/phosphoglucomutase [Bacilli bacterium]|nr:phosphomannomutase/phosphoglucomutase [Bacilli bacterium]